MKDLVKNNSKYKKDSIYFIPLGGTGEIGMNLNVYQMNNFLLAVDLGFTFADDSLPGIDLVMPDPEYLINKKNNLIALLITHGHEDHIGAIPYIWPLLECPIYATPFTAELITQKLYDVGFSQDLPINIVSNSDPITLGPFEVQYIPITHSIPEARSLSIKTNIGTIIHTGDWKLDKDPIVGSTTNKQLFCEIGDEGVTALVGDSTNVLKDGWSGSEMIVKETILKLFENRKGAIIITQFASNISRLVSIIEASQSLNREVVLVGRSLWKYFKAAKKTGVINNLSVLKEKEATNLHSDQIVFICTGCQGEQRAAMSKIADDSHPRVKINSGDTVIFSSKIIPGNEKPIALLKNKLNKRGIEIIDEKFPGIHVSGHPMREEIKELYSWLKPKVVVPVHGEIQHLESHSALAIDIGSKNAPIINNGDVLKLFPGKPKIIDNVNTGRLALDGSRLIHTDHPAIKERKKLKEDGIVFITIVMTKNRCLIDSQSITVHGVLDSEADELFLSQVVDIISTIINHSDSKLSSEIMIKENTQMAVRKFFKEKFGKKPRIVVHLIKACELGD